MFNLNFFLNRLDNLYHLGHVTDLNTEGSGGVVPPPSVTGTPIGLLLTLTREIPV